MLILSQLTCLMVCLGSSIPFLPTASPPSIPLDNKCYETHVHIFSSSSQQNGIVVMDYLDIIEYTVTRVLSFLRRNLFF